MSQTDLESEIEQVTITPELPQRGGHVRSKKTLLIWGGGGVVLVLLLIFGVRYLIWSAHHETTDDAYLAGHVHPIRPASRARCSKC